MSYNKPIRRIAIVGTGVIGASWAAQYLMDPLQGMMQALGTPTITPELKQTVIDGVAREAGGRSVSQLAQDENRVIIGLMNLRGIHSQSGAPTTKSSTTSSTTQRVAAK